MIFDLIPTDGHKSFYGKAQVIDDRHVLQLISYNTTVVCINKHTGEVYGVNRYSATTLRHLVAFFETFQDVWQDNYPQTDKINQAYITKNFTD